jgi:hypothetical protein
MQKSNQPPSRHERQDRSEEEKLKSVFIHVHLWQNPLRPSASLCGKTPNQMTRRTDPQIAQISQIQK